MYVSIRSCSLKLFKHNKLKQKSEDILEGSTAIQSCEYIGHDYKT